MRAFVGVWFVSIAWLLCPPVSAFAQSTTIPDTTIPDTTIPATTLPELSTTSSSTTTTSTTTSTTTTAPPTSTTEDPALVVARESRDVQTLAGGLLVFVAFAFLMLKAGRRGVS